MFFVSEFVSDVAIVGFESVDDHSTKDHAFFEAEFSH